MKMWKSLPLFTLALLGLSPEIVSAQPTTCSEEGNATCADNRSRVCLDTDGTEACGNCLNGFIEFKENCRNITEINFDSVVAELQPYFTGNRTDAERALILEAACVYISEKMSQIPPPESILGLTKFSMDTEEEAKQRRGFQVRDDANAPTYELWQVDSRRLQDANLPSSVDWRNVPGALTFVKDQGRCGCCWAVALAGALEGSVFVNTGFSQSLSFQQFISCDKVNFGCNGGDLRYAMKYAWQNQANGMASLNNYPFSDYEGSTTEECKILDEEIAASIDDPRIVLNFNDGVPFDERVRRMKAAVAYVPIATTIKSNCREISNYKNGILTNDGDCTCSSIGCIDHAIMMVGYNDDSNPPYWIMRNSWDEDWGEGGYFRISQAQKGDWGLFGVLSHGIGAVEGSNFTGQEADIQPPDDGDGLEPWAIAVIVVAAVLCCCCVVGGFFKFRG